MIERNIPRSNEFVPVNGRLIDTSLMYGRAEETVGELASHVPGAFRATKVWMRGRDAGIEQMMRSIELMGRADLIQVHNLVDWRTHWPRCAG